MGDKTPTNINPPVVATKEENSIFIDIEKMGELFKYIDIAYKRGAYTMEEICVLYPIYNNIKNQISIIAQLINNPTKP